ncbi:anhydro-N-acetylmuramic acid kinase [Ramlibacter sp. USB13]|uniref:Anhydro-N-acetylmuramic acid kinase n=1 Tax=Ramlibacter cellulosilyticus TaxID=2764187 RepID=A0A923MT76_9BURK|nr:anhydro-N-acetylmuramic acid kinase [Ramlibacter cellulosilyticus]MBC5784740.1 anhydro-N-acetylmuramic acid kinase [Ramlibacter cellulosilyticus]
MQDLFIGLMSGTSMDGVDGVIADFSSGVRVLQHASAPFDDALRSELMALNASGPDELHRGWLAGNALMRVYARVVADLLAQSGVAASAIAAIGAHGQTVRHRPQQFDGTGYTIQLAQPALLAELTGIRVVADFRSRDVAAGGQGAPLAPFFHRAVFARPGEAVGVMNIGGISNITLLRADGSMQGFDCGPGNALMDAWCLQHTGKPYDEDGRWAASGKVLPDLLAALLREPYFAQTPPKSTGRDLFNRPWLDAHLARFPGSAPGDVQATLTELTARACAADAKGLSKLIVCGGGALNGQLMRRLQSLLSSTAVVSSADEGLPPQQVEAAAFAWLAMQCLRGEKLDLQSTTGARGARVLGGIYPA